MSSSIYRLIMRWVHAKIYPTLVTWLHPHQYGGRRGVSPAHATLSLMDMIDAEASSDPRGHLWVTWGVYLWAGNPPLADIILSHPPDLT